MSALQTLIAVGFPKNLDHDVGKTNHKYKNIFLIFEVKK